MAVECNANQESRREVQVAVVTVTYNGAAVLPDFLRSLSAQTHPGVRLIAVDNASEDSSAELIESFGLTGVEVFRNSRNLGVAIGNNQGIRRASELGIGWVLLLNNDTVLPPDYISVMLSTASALPGSFVTTFIESSDPVGTVWYNDGTIRDAFAFKVSHPGRGQRGLRPPEVPREVEYAPTCSLLGRTTDFHRAGLMDEDYFVYYDDVDFSVRARRLGYSYVLAPSTVLLHKESSSTGGTKSPFSIWWESQNRIIAVRKLQSLPSRLFSYAFLAAWVAARFILRKDGVSASARRLRAFRAGLFADIGPSPQGSLYADMPGECQR